MNVTSNSIIMDIKEKTLEELTSDPKLIEYWKGGGDNLLNISNKFNDEYRNNALRFFRKRDLMNNISQYECLIDCVSKINAALHYKYINETDFQEKEIYYSLVAYTQIHINRLQNQCDLLIYWKQHKEYKTSYLTAIIIAIISFLFSLCSILLTL